MDCGKRCARCQLTKPHTSFYSFPPSSDGLQSWCIECHRSYIKEKRGIYNLKARLRKNAKRSAVHSVDVYCQRFGVFNFLGV